MRSHNSTTPSSIFVVQIKFKCFWADSVQSLKDILGRLVGGFDPKKIFNFLEFEISAYLSLVDEIIFLSFYWGGFVCYVNSGAHAPKYILANY